MELSSLLDYHLDLWQVQDGGKDIISNKANTKKYLHICISILEIGPYPGTVVGRTHMKFIFSEPHERLSKRRQAWRQQCHEGCHFLDQMGGGRDSGWSLDSSTYPDVVLFRHQYQSIPGMKSSSSCGFETEVSTVSENLFILSLYI